jgi:Flavodoxin
MKSIIIYSTKYGCTEKAAKLLKSKMAGETLTVNLMKEKVPPIGEYDTVILGGSIYIGRIQKELTNYINRNISELLNKKIGLFICAGSPDEGARAKELETSFPAELYGHAISKEVFGSEICFEKLGFFDKKILSMVQGSKESSYNLSEEKIESFARIMS